ncbi:hypothetical protein DV515_00005012, partial [Chloebia gouldiae]
CIILRKIHNVWCSTTHLYKAKQKAKRGRHESEAVCTAQRTTSIAIRPLERIGLKAAFNLCNKNCFPSLKGGTIAPTAASSTVTCKAEVQRTTKSRLQALSKGRN